MEFIIPEHPYGAFSIPASSREERSAPASDRLAALDPEQLPIVLTFRSGYHPLVFDAVINAVEPCTETGRDGEPADQEPFCSLCGAPVGIFLARGQDYRHYRGVLTTTSKPRPHKADHAPVIAWRPAGAAAALQTR